MKQEPLLRIEVESRTTPGKVYVVTEWGRERGNSRNEWRCGCPGFLFHLRKEGLDCKHISAVKQDVENSLRRNMVPLFSQPEKRRDVEQRGIEKVAGGIRKALKEMEKRAEVKTSPKVTDGVMLRKLLID